MAIKHNSEFSSNANHHLHEPVKTKLVYNLIEKEISKKNITIVWSAKTYKK